MIGNHIKFKLFNINLMNKLRLNHGLIITALLILSCNAKDQTATQSNSPAELSEIADASTSEQGSISYDNMNFYNGSVEIKVPSDFEVMDESTFRIKYPRQNPTTTTAFSNDRTTINFLLNLNPRPLNQENLATYHSQTLQGISQLNGIEIESSGIKEVNGKKVAFIAFNSKAIDTQIYNLMFFTDLNGQTLMCTYNCTYEHLKLWKSVGEEILNSIVVK